MYGRKDFSKENKFLSLKTDFFWLFLEFDPLGLSPGLVLWFEINFCPVLVGKDKTCGATAATSTKASLSTAVCCGQVVPGSNPGPGAVHAMVYVHAYRPYPKSVNPTFMCTLRLIKAHLGQPLKKKVRHVYGALIMTSIEHRAKKLGSGVSRTRDPSALTVPPRSRG